MNITYPEISVILSCYNSSKWLNQAIESILNQTFSNFEFIIINDGSIDNSLDIIKKYSNIDNRIKLIDKENTGLAHSLNLGLNYAQGKWVARIDADDYSEPTRFAEQLNYLTANSDVLLLGTGFIEIDANGHFLKNHQYPVDHNNLVYNLLHSLRFFPHSSVIYKLDIVKQLGGYRTCIKRAEDKDLWIRISEIGNIACIAKPLVKIRKHENQISNDEAGYRQILDDCACVVSYYIRQFGGSDPLTFENQFQSMDFFQWLDDQLKDSIHLESKLSWGKARSKYLSDKNAFKGIIKFCIYLFTSGNFLHILHDKLYGSNYSNELAIRWLNTQLKIK